MSSFSDDKPKLTPDADRFGHASFAKDIAESLAAALLESGGVMAVQGPWGSGKTTVRNFIAYYLKEIEAETPPLVFHFSPWMYSGLTELTGTFLLAFRNFLRRERVVKDKTTQVLERFAGVANRLPISLSAGIFGTQLDPEKLFKGDSDPEELTKKLAKALEEKRRKIIVTIDDIDRLSADEIRSLFRAIKAVADFPGVIYLLFYDHDVVQKALEKVQEGAGSDYVEKIVQVAFELPPPNRTSLRAFFGERLEGISRETKAILPSEQHWINVFLNGIDPLLDTPRKANRLLNLVSLSYPPVAQEVNIVDFVGICTLQLFAPDVFRFVRSERRLFTQVEENDFTRRSADADAARIELALNSAGALANTVRALLQQLFPQLSEVLGGRQFISSSSSDWFVARRVCSEEVFPLYFRMAPNAGEMTNAELQSLLQEMSKPDVFADHLLKLSEIQVPDGTTRARNAVERLWHYANSDVEIAMEASAGCLRALYDVADKLKATDSSPRSMFEFDMGVAIGRLAYRLYLRLRSPALDTLLKEVVAEASSIGFIINEVYVFGQMHGKYGESDTARQLELPISASCLDELEQLALERIRAAAEDSDTLWNHPELAMMLFRWRDWSTQEEPSDWLEERISTDAGLIHFVQRLRGVGHSYREGEYASREFAVFSTDAIQAFTDFDQFVRRAKALAPTATPSEQRELLQEFLEYIRTGGRVRRP